MARWMLARIWSASFVQVNGRGWSFRLSVKVPVAAVSSLTEVKGPRRMAWRVITGKKHSTMVSQEQLAGTTCRVIRWFSGLASHVRTSEPLPGPSVTMQAPESRPPLSWFRCWRAGTGRLVLIVVLGVYQQRAMKPRC